MGSTTSSSKKPRNARQLYPKPSFVQPSFVQPSSPHRSSIPPPYTLAEHKINHTFQGKYPMKVYIHATQSARSFVNYTITTPDQLKLILEKYFTTKWITFKLTTLLKCIFISNENKAIDFILKYSQFTFTNFDQKPTWQLSLVRFLGGTPYIPIDSIRINNYDLIKLMKEFKDHKIFKKTQSKFSFNLSNTEETINFNLATPAQILKEIETQPTEMAKKS